MKRKELMELGKDLANGRNKGAVRKIQQLFQSAVKKYGENQEALTYFCELLRSFVLQGRNLSFGKAMFEDILNIIRNDFLLKTDNGNSNINNPLYKDLNAIEFGYVLGYAARYAEVNEKLNGKGKHQANSSGRKTDKKGGSQYGRNEIKYQDRQPNELFNNSLASQIQEKMKNKK